MGRVFRLLTCAVLLCWLPVGGQAAKRVALVIGNAAYPQNALVTPHKDAALVADALREVGFSVDYIVDADRRQMLRAIDDLSAKLRDDKAVGFFYFSGIGVQAEGENHLLPIGAVNTSEENLPYDAVSLDRVLQAMDRGTEGASIVVIDAARSVSRVSSLRSLQRGLARVSAPTGTHIAFAAQPDMVAFDGSGAHGAYAQALADAIRRPGLELSQVFASARDEVYNATGRKQLPWSNSALPGELYLESRTSECSEAPNSACVDEIIQTLKRSREHGENITRMLAPIREHQSDPETSAEMELVFWQAIQDIDDADFFEHYLTLYPDGRFAELARLRLEMLRQTARDGETDPGNPPSRAQNLLGENERIARHPTVEAPDTVQVGARFPVQFWADRTAADAGGGRETSARR